jgi:hypothetical protein
MDRQRILPGWVEIGRIRHPTLDPLTIGSSISDLRNRYDPARSQQGGIDLRQLNFLTSGMAHKQIAGHIRRTRHKRNRTCTSDIKSAHHPVCIHQ